MNHQMIERALIHMMTECANEGRPGAAEMWARARDHWVRGRDPLALFGALKTSSSVAFLKLLDDMPFPR